MLFLTYEELPESMCFPELFVHILVALFPVLVLFKNISVMLGFCEQVLK